MNAEEVPDVGSVLLSGLHLGLQLVPRICNSVNPLPSFIEVPVEQLLLEANLKPLLAL